MISDALSSAYDRRRCELQKLAAEEDAPLGELLKPVFGAGDPHSAIVLVGEAPGKFETEAGQPFVGKAGQNLDSFLEKTGISRKSLFITNAVKYRPYSISPKGTKRNRTPTRRELTAGAELLFEELSIIQPRLVVTLGNSPLYALTGRADIGLCHGTIDLTGAYPLFPLYHPASLIYNPALAQAYEQDMLALYQYIHGPDF